MRPMYTLTMNNTRLTIVSVRQRMTNDTYTQRGVDKYDFN